MSEDRPNPIPVQPRGYTSEAPDGAYLDPVHLVKIPGPPKLPAILTVNVPTEADAGRPAAKGGKKYDGKKARPDLIPVAFHRALVEFVAWRKVNPTSSAVLDLRGAGWRGPLTDMVFSWRFEPQRIEGLDLLTLLGGMLLEAYAPDSPPHPDARERLLDGVADVIGYGAWKYGENNWQGLENGPARYLGALLRHLQAHAKGEANDEESGFPHLAHAACNVAFLLSFRNGFDMSVDTLLLRDVNAEFKEEAAAE